MSDLRRQWAGLSFEKQLSVVVVPIAVALVSVGVPLLAARDDPGGRAATQSESSVEAAAAEVSYAKDVGAVCDDMNAAQAARRRAALRLRERLDRAKTTIAQRNALIDDTQSTIDRFTRVFGAFRELGAPRRLARLHRATAGAWGDSLERLRRYRTLLAGGFTRPRLVAILERFPRKSGLIIEAQGVDVRAGLERLGGAECDLAALKTVRVFTLPPVDSPRPKSDPGPLVPTPRQPPPAPAPPVPTPDPAPPVPTPAPAPPRPTPAPAPPVPTPGGNDGPASSDPG